MKKINIVASVALFSMLITPLFASAASDGQIKVRMASPEAGNSATSGRAMMQIREREALVDGQGERAVPMPNGERARGASGTKEGLQGQNAEGPRAGLQAGDRVTQRRSRVANAVQGMLEIAGRNKGIGERVRVIAQAQGQNQESIEGQLKEVKNRGKLKKFFFGPDYKKINSAEEKILNHEEKIEELKKLAIEVTNEDDAAKLEAQITVMEEVKAELKKELSEEGKGFSLFGWLNRMMAK